MREPKRRVGQIEPKRKGETFSEYFADEKREQVVRRGELLAVMGQYKKATEERVWWRRIALAVQRYFARSAVAPLRDAPPE